KIIYTVTKSSISIFINGVLSGTTTVDEASMGDVFVRLSGNVYGSVYSSGTFKDFQVFPKALSESECIALTS
ncbi:MAG: hypothetical protein PF440_07225, partial [Thiomicrorhabdus sp.]|nr:hypothetical protein [Thiomicrorhabdus sp.]